MQNNLKKPLTYEQQLEHLIVDKKLNVENRDNALLILKHNNYYRLSGYMIDFLDKDDIFFKNITFEKIFNIYTIDKEMRSILFALINDIEVYFKLYITFFLSFHILSNVRKALFYRLYGHLYFLFTFAYRGISSYVFPLKRGKFRGKYFYAIRRFISVLALSIEECAYQSIVILILE